MTAARWPLLAFLVASAGVLGLCLLPGVPGLGRIPLGDKLAHAAAFALLAALGAAAGLRPWWALLLGLTAYGGAIELLQGLGHRRRAEWGDLAADAVGAALGLVAARLLSRPRPGRIRP